MDRTWISSVRKFTPSYNHGVEQFMEFVKQQFTEQSNIRCLCSRYLNLYELGQHDIHDHLLMFGISATYTRWTHHGESANVAPVNEFSEQVHGHEYDYGLDFQKDEFDHYDGIDVVEEANNDNEEMPDQEMILELYTALSIRYKAASWLA
ncbi:hypothetical protein C2845_PMPSC055468 [Panicum miliaceum]|uniref:Transposase-associated domain-containing protein n=1 Tax=Panicum miliaceum TaxID=4540 RepID=A0A3L6PB44_PANMI|nr:hypothetical protein C2845_PMPSC055468 [Panicum miliaceum]